MVLPPLQTGDRLSRTEFHRRYAALPDCTKAELIAGIVYVAPRRVTVTHSSASGHLAASLGLYEAYTPGIVGGIRPTVLLDWESEVQPDVLLGILSSNDGQSHINNDDYIEGAPELVAEIAASSSACELHEKLNVYRRNGVREYIAWRTWDRAIDWFRLHEGQFVPQTPDEQGLLKSAVFPGLWLDGTALLAGDQKRVLAVVQQGLASAEHQEFVTRLEAQRR